MLFNTLKLIKFKTQTRDHFSGTICEIYVDDLSWNIQFLLIKSDQTEPDTAFLVSYFALGEPDPKKQILPVSLSFKDKKTLPKISDSELHMLSPRDYVTRAKNLTKLMRDIDFGNNPALTRLGQHLRSHKNILNLKIEAVDGIVGNVVNLIVESDNWKVRYFVVQIQLSVHKSKYVLVSPSWVEKIIWNEKLVFVHFLKDAIRKSPSIEFGQEVTNQTELELIRYYRNRKDLTNDNFNGSINNI